LLDKSDKIAAPSLVDIYLFTVCDLSGYEQPETVGICITKLGILSFILYYRFSRVGDPGRRSSQEALFRRSIQLASDEDSATGATKDYTDAVRISPAQAAGHYAMDRAVRIATPVSDEIEARFG
jgi:hypothetical protein